MQLVKEILEKNTIVIDEPALRRGFTVVPNYLFGLKHFSHGARLTYVLLLKYAWQEGSCFPGVGRLAEDLQVERKSVMRYTHELALGGLIRIERRGQGKTNVYHLSRWQGPEELRPVRQEAAHKPGHQQRGRSPMYGTSGSPMDGTSRSPVHRTVLKLRGRRLRARKHSVNAGEEAGEKHPSHVAYVVEEILKVCRDQRSAAFYRQVARRFNDSVIFRLLSEIRQDRSIRNRGAVFATKVRALEHKPG